MENNKAVAAIEVMAQMLNVIDKSGGIQEGSLYAYTMNYISLEQFNTIIALMVKVGVVKKSGHLLVAIQPTED